MPDLVVDRLRSIQFDQYTSGMDTIQRHLLIFHSGWLNSRRKRVLCHYLPMVLLLTYLWVFYCWVLIAPPCTHRYIYTLPVCAAAPCYLLHSFLGVWDSAVHGCLPTLVVASANVALVVRVVMHKRRVNQHFQWRKSRRMIIQLLAISSLHLFFNLPLMLVWTLRLLHLVPHIPTELLLTIYFIGYWTVFLLPIVYWSSSGEPIKLWRRLSGQQYFNNPVTIPFPLGNRSTHGFPMTR
jgi:hypothetical protein